jgi:hypothetical protein
VSGAGTQRRVATPLGIGRRERMQCDRSEVIALG